MANIAVCLSGGPDSVTLLYQLVNAGHSVQAFVFNTGGDANPYELLAAASFADSLGVSLTTIDVSGYCAFTGINTICIHSADKVLKFGTAIMLSMVSALAINKSLTEVHVALHSEDAAESPEYSSSFISGVNSLLTTVGGVSGAPTNVIADYMSWTKPQILQHAVTLGVALGNTWSCLSPIDGVQDGTCGGCTVRRAAFASAGIPDPTIYAS